MKTGTKVISLIVLAALLGTAAITWRIRSGMRADYDRAMEAWVAVGFAKSLQDLRPDPLPAAENAAIVFEEAFRILGSLPANERNALGDPTGEYASFYREDAHETASEQETMRAEAVALNRATIEKLTPALDLAKQAAAMPRCHWSDALYDEGIDALMPWLANGRMLSQALRDRAAHRANEGRLDDAADDLATAIALANHIGADPTPIAQLVRWAIIEASLSSLETLFRPANHDAPEGRLTDLIRNLDLQAGLARSMEAQALVGLDFINRPNLELLEAFAMSTDITPGLLVRMWWYRDLDRAYMLDSHRELIEWASIPVHDRTVAQQRANAPSHAIISGQFVMEVQQIQEASLRHERTRLLAVLAMELRAHRRAHGEYPETRDLPNDPLSKQPIRYERTATGFRLSAGNETDPQHLQRTWEWE